METVVMMAAIFASVAYAYWQGINDGYSKGHEDGWQWAQDQERKDR